MSSIKSNLDMKKQSADFESSIEKNALNVLSDNEANGLFVHSDLIIHPQDDISVGNEEARRREEEMIMLEEESRRVRAETEYQHNQLEMEYAWYIHDQEMAAENEEIQDETSQNFSEYTFSKMQKEERLTDDFNKRLNPFSDKISFSHSEKAVGGMKLHPQNYKEVRGRIIFFLSDSAINSEDAEKVYQKLQEAKTLVITSYLKSPEDTRKYSLFLGNMVLRFAESTNKNYNFFVSCILKVNKAKERKEDLYSEKIFTIIPTGGVYVINKVDNRRIIRPETYDNSWSMDVSLYNELVAQMDSYFSSEDEEETVQEKITITERFRRNVLRPFQDFTDKENWVEKYKQAQGEGLSFFAQKFERKINKGNVYTFFSKESIVVQDEEEKTIFRVGDRVTVVDTKHGDRGVYTGEIEDITTDTPDGTAVSIAFFHQSDDNDFPKTGKIIMAVNDTQTRVRNRVIGALERTKVESKYMYKTFSDFSTAGYRNIPDDLKEYVLEKLAEKNPPNQMQLEAIIKGILTEDILLVLGPPGTGKTTVISYWVEYFIKHGQRVLISSQNNSAVDNVLSRFKNQGEIVRLGNEAKVQEDCKEFLPQNKIESMQAFFNANQERVEKELADDMGTIAAYRKVLKRYQDLYTTYATCYTELHIVLQSIREMLVKLGEVHKKILFCANEIQDTERTRVRKEIFIGEYNKKNFFIRLFRQRIAELVKREIVALNIKHSELLHCHNNYICQYNALVAEVKDQIKQLRNRKLIVSYKNALSEVMTQNSFLSTSGQFPPTFISALGHLYTPVKYGRDLRQNMRIVSSEMRVMTILEEKGKKVIKATKTWTDIVNNDRNDIMQKALLETCQIVGATCIGINSNRDFANVKFDVSIVDEAGQIQIHNALIPMTRAPKNLLLGDYKQIPPSADPEVIAACKAEEIDTKLLEMSFFEFLFESIRKRHIKNDPSEDAREKLLQPAIPEYSILNRLQEYNICDTKKMIESAVSDNKKLVNLNRQFRMPGNISSVISEWFYEGNYYSSYDMKRFKPLLPGTKLPLIVLATGKDKYRYEKQPQNKRGYMNCHEAEIVAEIVAKVIENQPEETRDRYIASVEYEMGIISAYSAQVRLIREHIAKRIPDISSKQLQGMVASLDSFQGQERPLIIYSLTRSRNNKNPDRGRVGFMKELRRLNVAFTRAQQQLVVVGDVDYLECCMNTQQQEDEKEWACSNEPEEKEVGKREILQCNECDAVCERKFARFIRLLLQHVSSGEGELIYTKDYINRGA